MIIRQCLGKEGIKLHFCMTVHVKCVKVQMILYSYTWYQKYGGNEKETTNDLCNYTREILYGIREYVDKERNHEFA